MADSRSKGSREERRLARWLTEHLWPYVSYERNGRNGITSTDVIVSEQEDEGARYAEYELKARASLPQWLKRGIEQAEEIGDHGVLVLRETRGPYYFVLTEDQFLSEQTWRVE